MKKLSFFLISLAFFYCLVSDVYAQGDSNALQITGYLMSDQRILTDNAKWFWNENRLNIAMDKKLSGALDFHTQLWIRNIGFPSVHNLNMLSNKHNINYLDLELREFYVKVYNFLVPNLDMTIGRQIIEWGTADKINPTSNVSPYDYEDILDFGRKRGNEALNLVYTFGKNKDFYLQGIWEPFFRPDNLPIYPYSQLLSFSPKSLPAMSLLAYSDSLIMPSYSLKNSIAAFKLKGFAFGTDWSLSYIYTFDGLPMPYQADYYMISPNTLNLNLKMTYYREHIIGADFSTNIFGAGFWGEAAAFIPKKDVSFSAFLHTPNPIMPLQKLADSIILQKNKPFFKYVVGFDYNFPYDFYIHLQYVHGFTFERGADNLNDYFFFNLDKSLFYGKLKLSPATVAFIVNDWNDIANNYVFAYFPSLVYKPVEDLELNLSGAYITAKGDQIFAKLKDWNMVQFRVKYYF